MDAIMYTHILRSVALVASILGLLVGLDLLFGGPIVTVSKRILDRSFDLEKWLKRTLERSFNFDKIITNPKIKIGLGVAFLVLSLIMLLLSTKVKI
jgi:hypothetical protein